MEKESMPEWAINHFAHARSETWIEFIRHHALATRVLCVAHTRREGAWCAYCDAVPGQNHDNEMLAVLREGDKLDESVAIVLFPEFEGIPYAR